MDMTDNARRSKRLCLGVQELLRQRCAGRVDMSRRIAP